MAAYIPSLKGLIKKASLEKAKKMLADLGAQSDSNKQAAIELLALAPDKPALDLLGFVMEADAIDPATRERLFQLATDRAHLNFAFTRLLLDHGDKTQILQATPLLKHILSRETSGDLLNLIIRTAGKLRIESLTEDVAEFIFYDEPALKREAVKALERMANPRALHCLKQVAATEKCDRDIMDAIEMLEPVVPLPDTETPKKKAKIRPEFKHKPQPAKGLTHPVKPGPEKGKDPGLAAEPVKADALPDNIEANTALLMSKNIEDRLKAFTYFSDRGSRVAKALHTAIEAWPDAKQISKNHDILLNLLLLTARTIPEQAVNPLLTLAARDKTESSIRFAVYNALLAYPELESAAGIIKGITDPVMHVRMAAVKTLDRHCTDYIVAEIKTKIESGSKTGQALALTILDTRASNLINALMSSDTFSYIASNHLQKSASAPVFDAFIDILEKRNLRSTIKKYAHMREQNPSPATNSFVVINTSRPYLDVYVKLIHGCGYGVRTFSSPQQAFESIALEQPAAIICDLFTKEVTAMDFAREIREFYPGKQVPIIVSSLQKNLDRKILDPILESAGINGFCDFPAKAAQIKSWVNKP